MRDFPAAYYKKDGKNSINLAGKRVNYDKAVAADKKEAAALVEDGWCNSLVDCFKPKTKAKPKAEK